MLKRTLIIAILLLGVIPLVSADYSVINLTFKSAQQRSANPFSIDQANELLGTDYRLFVASTNDDTVSIYNTTDSSNPIGYSHRTAGAPPTSLDGAQGMSYDPDTGLLYVCSQIDDGFLILNTSNSQNLTVIGGAYTNAANPFSMDTCLAIAHFKIGGNTYVAVPSMPDDTLTILNVTNPAIPTNVTWYINSATPCSIDDARDIHYDDDLGVLIVASQADDAIALLNITPVLTGGNVTCIASYADSASPFSVDGVQKMSYDDERNMIMVPSLVDVEYTLLNISNYSINVVGNYSNPTMLASTGGLTPWDGGFVTKEGNHYYNAIIRGNGTVAGQIMMLNISRQDRVTLAANRTVTNGSASCTGNDLRGFAISNNDNTAYLTDIGANGNCLYSVDLFSTIVEEGGEEDTCTYGGSGDWNINLADNCVLSSSVDVGANSVIVTGTGSFTIESTGSLVASYFRFYANAGSVFRRAIGGVLRVQ